MYVEEKMGLTGPFYASCERKGLAMVGRPV